MRVFSHEWIAGDLIYHLPCIKQAGGGELVLYLGPQPNSPPTTGYSLLRAQPYITGVRRGAQEGIDLGGWRQHYRNDLNLCDIACAWLGQRFPPRCQPWLHVPKVQRVARVVINRCPRWHNDLFPWLSVWEEYRNDAVFVGFPDEHVQFVQDWGPIPYHPTKDYLALAEVLAGADLFIGNQSSAMALAEGMKLPVIQETLPRDNHLSNCIWDRLYRIHGFDPTVELPPQSGLRERWAGCRGSIAEDRSLLTEAARKTLALAARETEDLPGDMAELGVARGGASKVMASICPHKTVHLFDTFTGLPVDEPDCRHRRGEFATSLEEVRAFLNGFRVVFHVGMFPATVVGLEEARYSLVHLDGDLESTTRAGIEYFWPRLVPGGLLIFDDVDWELCPGVNRALESARLMGQLERPLPNQGRLRKARSGGAAACGAALQGDQHA